MPDPKLRLLVSLHGVRTKGAWQEGLASVLAPFYDYRGPKYSEYQHRFWGALKIAVEPATTVFLLAIAAVLLALGFYTDMLRFLVVGCVALGILSASWIYAKRVRDRAVDGVYQEIKNDALTRRPHVIAHSFGTFVIGSAIQKRESLRLDTLILNGCVLPRKFNWQRSAMQFESVYNEVGGADWVPMAASLVPELGSSGRFGFRGVRPHVHTLETPYETCRRCPHDPAPCVLKCDRENFCSAQVHNVKHRRLSHDGFEDGQQHALGFWLPALWGLHPLLFREFMDLALWCRDHEGEKTEEFQNQERKLRQQCWGWTGGTLESFLRRNIAIGRGQRPEEVSEADVDLAVRTMWQAFGRAVDQLPLETRDAKLFQALEPRTAATRAVQNLVRTGEPKH